MLAFNPGARKLRHSCALAIDVLASLGAHTLIKSPNRYLILRDSDSAPSLFQSTLSATGLSRRTDVAFFFSGYVHTDRAAGLVIEVLETEALVLWTNHLIC